MPRTGRGQTTPAAQAQQHLLWAMTGGVSGEQIWQWDPKAETLVQAVLEVLATGCTVVLRPGSGGRSIGVAIWEGDTRHQPVWTYEAEELDTWAAGIVAIAEGRRRSVAD